MPQPPRRTRTPGAAALIWTLLRLIGGVAGDALDTILVWVGLKYRPATGPARWGRSARRIEDPRADAWQRRIAAPPCPHRDATGASWIIPVTMVRDGRPHQARTCVQCMASWPVADEPTSGAGTQE